MMRQPDLVGLRKLAATRGLVNKQVPMCLTSIQSRPRPWHTHSDDSAATHSSVALHAASQASVAHSFGGGHLRIQLPFIPEGGHRCGMHYFVLLNHKWHTTLLWELLDMDGGRRGLISWKLVKGRVDWVW
jgi:hypothetical protein